MNARRPKYFVTGGAGFLGSHMVDRLLQLGVAITVFDNFSSGRHGHAADLARRGAAIVHGDVREPALLAEAMSGHDVVVHLAAFTDTKSSNANRLADFENGTIGTRNVLEAMVASRASELIFPSSQLVYGDLSGSASETAGPLRPVSLFGASKLACEGLISAYTHTFGFKSTIGRLSNIVGARMRGGILVDFIERLQTASDRLEILGNGRQTRSYLDAEDCVGALLHIHRRAVNGTCEIYNIGNDDGLSALDVARIVTSTLYPHRPVEIVPAGGDRGWSGDVPTIRFDVSKLRSTGWRPRLAAASAVREAVVRLSAERCGVR